jgi:hypothetical protein
VCPIENGTAKANVVEERTEDERGGTKIPASDASALIAKAQQIEASIPC